MFLYDEAAAAHGSRDGSVTQDGEVSIAVDPAALEDTFDSQVVAVHRDAIDSAFGVDVDISTGPDAPVVHRADLVIVERYGGGAAQTDGGERLFRNALREIALKAVDVAVALPGNLGQEAGQSGDGRVVSRGGGDARNAGLGGEGGSSGAVPGEVGEELKLLLAGWPRLLLLLQATCPGGFGTFRSLLNLVAEREGIFGGRADWHGLAILDLEAGTTATVTTEC